MWGHCTAVALLVFLTFANVRASELRAWTDSSGKTIEAKIVGFEKDSLKFSRQSGVVHVNGIQYAQVNPRAKKLVDLLIEREGFNDIEEAVPKDSTEIKEIQYLRVVFQMKDGAGGKTPMEALRGVEDNTGDYKLALDESREWFKAHPDEDDADEPEEDESGPDPNDEEYKKLDGEQKKLEQDRGQLEAERRRYETEGSTRSDQDRRRWEEDLRRREDEYRRREEHWRRDKGRADAERHNRDAAAKAKRDAAANARAAAAHGARDAKKAADAARKKREEQQKKQQPKRR